MVKNFENINELFSSEIMEKFKEIGENWKIATAYFKNTNKLFSSEIMEKFKEIGENWKTLTADLSLNDSHKRNLVTQLPKLSLKKDIHVMDPRSINHSFHPVIDYEGLELNHDNIFEICVN